MSVPPADRSLESSLPVEAVIEARLLHAAYERKPLNLLMTVAVTVVLGGLLWTMFPTTLMAVWLLGILLSALVGFVEWRAFQLAAPGLDVTRHWKRVFMLQAAFAGAAWALGPTLMLRETQGASSALFVSILLCVCAVAMVSVAAQRWAMRAFILAALAPPVAALALSSHEVERMVALVLVCGMFLLIVVGDRFNQAARESLETQYQIRSVLDTSLDAVIGVDEARRITDWNLRAESVFGWTKDEALGRSLAQTLLPIPLGELKSEGLREFLETGATAVLNQRIEATAMHRAGRQFPVELAITSFAVGDKLNFTAFIADITQRKQAAAALHASEERFRTLTEWSPEAIAVHRQGRLVYVNPAAVKLFGAQTAHDLVGTPILDRVHPEYRSTVLERVKAVAQTRMPTPMIEEKLLKLDGTTIDVEVQSTPIEFDGEQSVQVAVRDISERKRGEWALASTNRQLAALIEAIPDAIFLKDGAGRWLITNETAKRLFRLHDIPWQGKTEMELAALNPELRAAHETCLIDDEKAWQARGLTLFSETVLDDAGQSLEFEVRKMPIFDESGRRQALLIIGRDVTQSRRAEEALRIAATAFESQEGMTITNAQGIILRVNRAFTDITGYSADEAVGRSPRMLQSGLHNPAFYTAMWETIGSTGSWQGEVWNKRKNGEIFPEWLSVTAVKTTGGDVTHYVGTFTDITRRKTAEDEIRHLAFYDSLTRLPNRRLLLDRLKQALVACSRSSEQGALLFIDLDHFKNINDTLGHYQGDLLLEQVAARLVTCVREGDTVARLGGDEFVVMLEELGADKVQAAAHARSVGEKILLALNQLYQLGQHEHHNTSSIGITLFGDNPHEGADEPMKRADLAMYQAKMAGRNTLRFFEPLMQSVVTARAELESDLREAVARQQFVLNYQAQVDGAGDLTGVEALVRWRHPKRGTVSPGEFIPAAEDTGLILPLGRWVLQTACLQLALWAERAQMAHLNVAVNVSARQFHHEGFVEQVLQVLEQTGANPLRLKLELTESLLVDDIEEVIQKMTVLKSRGVGFSLDDFGTGYSSLAYLKRLPLDQLKIDQGFVRDILIDPNDAAIAKTVVALANSLGLAVIAEGVETAEQRDFLANNGCLAYQGYFFSRPLPIEEFEMFAASRQVRAP